MIRVDNLFRFSPIRWSQAHLGLARIQRAINVIFIVGEYLALGSVRVLRFTVTRSLTGMRQLVSIVKTLYKPEPSSLVRQEKVPISARSCEKDKVIPESPLEELQKTNDEFLYVLLKNMRSEKADSSSFLAEDRSTRRSVKMQNAAELENRIKILMSKTPLETKSNCDNTGLKHLNIKKLRKLVKKLNIPEVSVPKPHSISDETITHFLGKLVPEVFTIWNEIGELYKNQKCPANFLQMPEVKKCLAQIDRLIEQAFNEPNAFQPLGMSPEFVTWLKEMAAKFASLMVRSSGAEDAGDSMNAGGNLSKAYVSPDEESFCKAVGEVVRSYFSEVSLQNRLNSRQNPFDNLKMAVTCQELIGEPVGGAIDSHAIPTSLVLFTNDPLHLTIQGEKFRVMRISATYGHGEGVVGNLGIPTDTIFLLISETKTNQIHYVYDNVKKEERLAPVLCEEGIVLRKVRNPDELVERPALTPEFLSRLYHLGVITDAFFQNDATDMELVIDNKKGTIYPVQARPLNSPAILPTYIDPRQFSALEKSPVIKKIDAEPLVPGKASAFVIQNKDEILVAETLKEAEAVFKRDLHKLVIVRQPEPANSHPVVNFTSLGVSCVLAPDVATFNQLEIDEQIPLVVCIQTGALYLWDSRQATVETFVAPGFAVHPAKIAQSILIEDHPSTSRHIKSQFLKVKEKLSSLVYANSGQESQGLLASLKELPEIKNLFQSLARLPSLHPHKEIRKRAHIIRRFIEDLNVAFNEVERSSSVDLDGQRLRYLFHIKVLESLLVGHLPKGGSVGRYALPDIWALIEDTSLLTDHYQSPYSEHTMDLVLFGKYTFTTEAKQSWNNFLEELGLEIEQKAIDSENVICLKNMLSTLESFDRLSEWLCFHFSPCFQQQISTKKLLEQLLLSLPERELPLVEEQLRVHQHLEKIHAGMSLFARRNTFENAFSKLKDLAYGCQEIVRLPPDESSWVTRAMVNSNMKKLIDTYDAAIKTMKASDEWNEPEKVALFRDCLISFSDLLRISIDNFLSRHGSYPGSRLSNRNSMLKSIITVLNTNPDSRGSPLQPSPNFSVACQLIGYSSNPPITYEDCFTFLHQLLLEVVARHYDKAYDRDAIANSSLPVIVKAGINSIKKVGANLINLKTHFNGLLLTFNCPLRDHSAQLVLLYENQKSGISLRIQFFGGNEWGRWRHLAGFVNFLHGMKIVSLETVPYVGQGELDFSIHLEGLSELDAFLAIFRESLCPFSSHGGRHFTTFIEDWTTENIGEETLKKATEAMLNPSMTQDEKTYVRDVLNKHRARGFHLTDATIVSQAFNHSDFNMRINALQLSVYLSKEFQEDKIEIIKSGINDRVCEVRMETIKVVSERINKIEASLVIKICKLGVLDSSTEVQDSSFKALSDIFFLGSQVLSSDNYKEMLNMIEELFALVDLPRQRKFFNLIVILIYQTPAAYPVALNLVKPLLGNSNEEVQGDCRKILNCLVERKYEEGYQLAKSFGLILSHKS